VIRSKFQFEGSQFCSDLYARDKAAVIMLKMLGDVAHSLGPLMKILVMQMATVNPFETSTRRYKPTILERYN